MYRRRFWRIPSTSLRQKDASVPFRRPLKFLAYAWGAASDVPGEIDASLEGGFTTTTGHGRLLFTRTGYWLEIKFIKATWYLARWKESYSANHRGL